MSNSCSVSYRNTGALHFSHGYKARLVDVNGIEYLDTRNNVAHVGHGHPEVVRAITYQMETLQTNTRYLHPHAALLAKKLSDLLPDPLAVVFFANSGSEANDLALRLARAYEMQQAQDRAAQSNPQAKSCVVTIDHGYHGHTLATIDISPYKHRQGREVKECPDYVRMVPCPDVYRGIHSAKKNDHASEVEAAEKYASYVEDECAKITAQGDSVRCLVMEGGMSVAGVILPPKSYLSRCVEAARKAGGVYIADEVQTGFGRLGKCMWAFQYSNDETEDGYEIIPDIVTGKFSAADVVKGYSQQQACTYASHSLQPQQSANRSAMACRSLLS